MHLEKPYRFLTGVICLSLLLHCQTTLADPSRSAEKTERMIVVLGAEGTSEYGQQFADWSNCWQQLAADKQAALTLIGDSVDARHSDLELVLHELHQQTDYTATWLILIGHGTFDGKTARFNLRGPDLTADALNQSCHAIQHPLAVINCFSSSAPFLETLSAKNRVVTQRPKQGMNSISHTSVIFCPRPPVTNCRTWITMDRFHCWKRTWLPVGRPLNTIWRKGNWRRNIPCWMTTRTSREHAEINFRAYIRLPDQ